MADHLFLTVMTDVTAIVFAVSMLIVAIEIFRSAAETISDRRRRNEQAAGRPR